MINKKKTIGCLLACAIFLSAILGGCSDSEGSVLSKAFAFMENHKPRTYITSDETFKVNSLGGEFDITITSVQVYDSYEESKLPAEEKIGIYSEKNPDDDCVFFLVSMDIKCIKETEFSDHEDETERLFNIGNFFIYPKDDYSDGRIADCICYFSDSYDHSQYAYGFLLEKDERKNISIGILAKKESAQMGNTVLSNDTLFLDENGKEFFVLLDVDG